MAGIQNELDRFREILRRAAALELPYSERPPRKGGTPAAVLALLAFSEASAGPFLLMTQRADTLEHHKGQMAFPGGACEDADSVDPEQTEIVAALRETEEEIGVSRDRVEVIGALPPLWTITDYWVTPVIGLAKIPLEEIQFEPNSGEIARVFWIPLETLQHDAVYAREFIHSGAVRYPIHVYQVGSDRIWGATGAMIKNLLDRLSTLS